jgi:phosphoribosyl 1,2-cyclic phosphate phosphodiesterase
MKGMLRLLGTGASTGIPVIGCTCPTCLSTNPCNKRLRTSAALNVDGKEFLIDCSPDYRQQALTYGLTSPQALFITHTHYDHVGGLEELRAYRVMGKGPIQCYLSQSSFENIKKLYYYHFLPDNAEASFSAKFDFHVLDGSHGDFVVDGVPVSYFSYYQGDMPVTGFRFGSLAYVMDIKTYDASLFSRLQGLDTLLISALRRNPSRMQLTIDEAIAFSERIRPKKTYCVHIAHETEHEKESRRLPQSVQLAYDGLELEFHA